MPQLLNARDQNLFRTVIKCYEDKHYKRGLKTAEQILKKNPKHGDTMSMKALIMNAQGKTEEAFALAKEALTIDMKSHICWHVYGILYRTNKNFDEAIKAYKFALRLEPESQQIQRDLALLQVQMRDYQGYIQSRLAMLKANPRPRQNWTALAVAHHLEGDLEEAENVLTKNEVALKESGNAPPLKTDLENSEAILYKNTIIAERGDIERALEHLETEAKNSLDRLAYLELRAKYLEQLDRKEEAIKACRTLLDRNPDNSEFYTSLIRVMGLENGDEASKKAVFDEYAAKFPRSDAARRLPLDFLTGESFREAAKRYLTAMFDKGVPSTFANLKHLYKDSSKKETLPFLAEEYLADIKNGSSEKEQANGDSSKGEGAALYFLAQHYNYYLSRDLAKATEYNEKALALDPKNVDFNMTKARIYKHQGNLQKASEAMDHARSVDTRDRYINSKAAKYQLRNNENEKALLKTLGMFTRAETVGGPLADLTDMQAVWYLTEDGEAWARRGNIGLALKRFHTVYNIFDIWQEDQFDFHSFSLRKGQIRAYVDMIRWEDKLREHPFYSRVAIDAVKLYLSMFDKPKTANGVNGVDRNVNGEDAAVDKKAAKKAKKEAQKAEREAAEKAAKQDPNKPTNQKTKEGEEPKKTDDDPEGLRLAATTDPLGEAMKFLGPMIQFSPKLIDAQLIGFDVYLRRKKYLLALRCINAALSLDKDHPRVHEQAIEFRKTVDPILSSLPEKVQEIIKSDFTAVSSGADLKQLNAQFRQKHQDSPEHVLAAVRTAKLLGEDQAQCEKDLTGALNNKNITFEHAANMLDTLRQWAGSGVASFQKAAHEKWPEVTMFS